MTGVDILLHINLSPIMWYAPSSTARLLIEFYVDKETGALCDYEVQYRVCTRSRVLFVLYYISMIVPVRSLIALRLSVVLTTFVMINGTSTVCCASRNGYLRGKIASLNSDVVTLMTAGWLI